MKTLTLKLVAFTLISMSQAFAEEPGYIINPWRYVTDSQYRAERIKQGQQNTKRLLPILGRIRACGLAEEIVAAPTEWRDNTRRIAAIPSVLRVHGLELTDDFKAFRTSAIAITEFAAQIQSASREQVARQLATETERASHNINVEATIDPKLLAKYDGTSSSESHSSAEKQYTEKSDLPAMTAGQATTFHKLYSQLVLDYEAVTKQLPTTAELMGGDQLKK